jgi:hypothetical protein
MPEYSKVCKKIQGAFTIEWERLWDKNVRKSFIFIA